MTTKITIESLSVCKSKHSSTFSSVGKVDYVNGNCNFLTPKPHNNHGLTSLPFKQTQTLRIVQQSVKIGFVFFGVQSEGSPTAFTEDTGRDKICDAGLCSMQRSIVERGVTRCGQFLCLHFYIYTEQNCAGYTNIQEGGVQGRISSIMKAIALNLTMQYEVRNFGTEVHFWSR